MLTSNIGAHKFQFWNSHRQEELISLHLREISADFTFSVRKMEEMASAYDPLDFEFEDPIPISSPPKKK